MSIAASQRMDLRDRSDPSLPSPTTGIVVHDSPTSTYWLSKHVFLGLSERHIVLLDLRNDRYMALDAARVRGLASLVPGWPAYIESAHDTAASICDYAAAIAKMMIERDLLTTSLALGKDATPVSIALPSAMLLRSPSLVEEEDGPRVTIRGHHVIAMLATSLMAAASLRWRSLEHVVHHVAHRRIRHATSSDNFKIEIAKELVEIFYRLRPFVFTAQNACLFDSLALIHFLSRYGLFPRWVFGIRTAPFSAHCWVQEGATVLNDSVEHVSFYTPIMVV